MADNQANPAGGAPIRRRRWGLVIAVAALLAIAGWTQGAWKRSVALADEKVAALVARESAAVAQEADVAGFNIGRSIAYLYGIPSAIADQEKVIDTLAQFGPDAQRSEMPRDRRAEAWLVRPDLMSLNRHLARVARELGSDVVFVMNAGGDCVAASNHDTNVSLVGGNFADREYFQQPLAGGRGRQYAMGRVTNVPGLFFSAPVVFNGRFVGAVAAKIDVPRLSHWVARSNAFVADGNGVVILARDKKLEMRALDDAAVFRLSAEARDARYKRREFEPLRLVPAQVGGYPSLVRFDGSPLPYVMARREIEGDEITIHVMAPLDAIGEIRRDTRSAFFLLAFSGIAAILLAAGGAAYLVRASQHRRSMERANAALNVLNAQLSGLASTDALTGCANRRAFLGELAEEMARVTRYAAPLSVISLDIDHFKTINDTYGHGGGDEALKHFCVVAGSLLRTQDVLGRIGGEEFAILLPDTAQGGALALAERVRSQIELVPAQYGGFAIAMTVSCGVAERRHATDTPEDLLRRADDALYAAKRGGRNRVCTAAAEGEGSASLAGAGA